MAPSAAYARGCVEGLDRARLASFSAPDKSPRTMSSEARRMASAEAFSLAVAQSVQRSGSRQASNHEKALCREPFGIAHRSKNLMSRVFADEGCERKSINSISASHRVPKAREDVDRVRNDSGTPDMGGDSSHNSPDGILRRDRTPTLERSP
jgi:hypothetical protein